MTVHHDNHELHAQATGKRLRAIAIVGSKDLNAHIDRRISNPATAHAQPITHPWKAWRHTTPRP